MVVDHDARRPAPDDAVARSATHQVSRWPFVGGEGSVDVDETELAEAFELPGADMSGEELRVRVVPQQTDEFVCTRCFLICHRTQRAAGAGDLLVCRDCLR